MYCTQCPRGAKVPSAPAARLGRSHSLTAAAPLRPRGSCEALSAHRPTRRLQPVCAANNDGEKRGFRLLGRLASGRKSRASTKSTNAEGPSSLSSDSARPMVSDQESTLPEPSLPSTAASTRTSPPSTSFPDPTDAPTTRLSYWESSASLDDDFDTLPGPEWDTLLPGSWNLDMRRRGRRKRSLTLDVLASSNANHAVMDLIEQRILSGSKPRERTDGARLALVVEGGGMRGAVSGAMLAELSDLGMADAFDEVYGSSAGAINLTYYLAGQMYGLDAYTEDLAGKHFMDLRRLLQRKSGQKPALDLDFLLYKVLTDLKPLNFDAVLNSKVPLNVVASCVDSMSPVVMNNFSDMNDLLACLKASANVPAVAGPPLVHRGRRLVDAAIFEPIPFNAALKGGATHVLVLCTRPAPSGPMKFRAGRSLANSIKRIMLRPHAKRDDRKELRKMLREGSETGLSADQVLMRALSCDAEAEFGGAHVLPVYPGKAGAYAPVCVDPDLIEKGISEGRDVVSRLFERIITMRDGR